MATFAALLMLVIGLGYIAFGFAVVGVLGRKLYKWANVNKMSRKIRVFIITAICGTIIFLLGCAGTHFEIMAHLATEPEFAQDMAVHMVVTGIPQAIGVWGSTWLLILTAKELDKATNRVRNGQNKDGE